MAKTTTSINVSVRRMFLAKDQTKTVKAFADIDVNGIGVDGFRVLDNGQQAAGIGVPNRSYKDKQNNIVWAPTFHCDEATFAAISQAIIQAWKAKTAQPK